ncbi:uncharacterized protein F4822DRAFT_426537 [Hypoxylon trugodes]|uniref:uncharacterized protein n=1 Tax=Hypoxylon trugodes TaxID=326681 RepID=UPI00218D4008|nr:uncharacterized protein F4822DRAFT_426537 [Hypoxylon trugodes]KAI1390688.1 hypothetical protein F4822DRAFT_426537 [Hypoxylon trugodes]
MSECEPRIKFDPRGDLTLRVGPPDELTSNLFLVCSRTLARTSPVFDRMLYGSFAEAKPVDDKDWVVDLPNDDPASLTTFIRMTHGSFTEVPKTMTIDRLYALTTLTHYYDATQVLIPWIDPWLASVEDETRDSNVPPLKLLWIAWEFGRKALFKATARRILFECPASLLEPYLPPEGLQMPPDVIEKITEIRHQTIEAFLRVFRDMVAMLLVVDESPRWCRHASYMGHHRCESMILGSMTFCLARASLWPLPEADEVEESVVELYTKLTNLVIHDIGRQSPKGAEDHSECNPVRHLMEEMKKILNEVPDPITDMHWKQMDLQYKRLNPSDNSSCS